MTFDEACSTIGDVLTGDVRREIVNEAAASPDLGAALARLREGMRSQTFHAGTRTVKLDSLVRTFDRRTAAEGFHALHDWDGVAGRFNNEIIPVDVLDYLIQMRGTQPVNPAVLAMLLDYHLMYVLALLSMRVWDDGQPNANLDRLTALLGDLQGPDGSGQPFATNAETLFLIATSHYEPDERGYDRLLDRVRALNHTHQTLMGLCHASAMGSHLRFGFEATYNHDIAAQRDDNVVDYPWLAFALFATMREFSRMHEEGIPGVERERVVEALFNGLSADVAHFRKAPSSHESSGDAERLEFADLLRTYRQGLVGEFERLRPSAEAYSPLSFFFNFSHNIVKGTVIDALLWGEPWPVSFNDLLTGAPGAGAAGKSKARLATTLMGYARANPHKIRGRLMPVVVYDPLLGRRVFGSAMRALKA
jgi:hypothetical protein